MSGSYVVIRFDSSSRAEAFATGIRQGFKTGDFGDMPVPRVTTAVKVVSERDHPGVLATTAVLHAVTRRPS